MSLINCPACSTEVSTEAASCPKCGHPFKESQPIVIEQAQSTSGCGLFFLIVASIIAAVVLLSIGE